MGNNKVLITGGAGYLGRCTAEIFRKKGITPVILDNYSASHRISSLPYENFETDLEDFEKTKNLVSKAGPFAAIIHFAAKALVSESCEKPALYFRNNINATITVAQLATDLKIPFIVHSSSCSVYGTPAQNPIPETAPLNPVTPYGQSKLASEKILESYSGFGGFKVLCLRYFNPAGAIWGGEIGELHDPETHLIPCIVTAFDTGKPLHIYGNDYPTPDGTCIRDYIHVEDLVEAHWLALNHLKSDSPPPFSVLNIGRGTGNSVLDVVHTAERVLGKKLEISTEPRRAGDPSELVADTKRMQTLFNWTPKKDLENMVLDHLKWVRSRLKN